MAEIDKYFGPLQTAQPELADVPSSSGGRASLQTENRLCYGPALGQLLDGPIV